MNTIAVETKPTKLISLWGGSILNKVVIVLISGKMGSGKSTTANMLKSRLSESGISIINKMAFADKVKECAKAYFKWDGVKDSKGRKLLQSVGNVGREYDKDLWVDYIVDEIMDGIIPPDVIIIDDWRFPNEFNKLKELDKSLFVIVTVRIIRGMQDLENSDDVSETSLTDFMEYDVVIDNDGTLDDLRTSVKELEDYILSL